MDRRKFLGTVAAGACVAAASTVGCSGGSGDAQGGGRRVLRAEDLPPAQPDAENPFGVDANINIQVIDDYLDAEGVAKRDLRLVQDPARYEAIGGNSELSMALPGFRVVPYPYMGTLSELPVSGAYEGDRLFDVEWAGENGLEVVSAEPRYTQSMQMVEELFPKNTPIFLVCGGGGYAAMMKALLVYLGWNAEELYVLGGMWDYAGDRAVMLASYATPGAPDYYLWRADVAYIDFSLLHKAG